MNTVMSILVKSGLLNMSIQYIDSIRVWEIEGVLISQLINSQRAYLRNTIKQILKMNI